MEYLFRNVLKTATDILEKEGIEDANTDAWLLAEYTLGITKQKYYMDMGMNIDEDDYKKYLSKIELRRSHIPLQHITGHQEFMGYDFLVNENVLIPRQDTELLVEKTVMAVEILKNKNCQNRTISILDMCTGSGAIAVSLAKLCKNVKVFGADISDKALDTARKNAEKNGADVNFVKTDMFENIEGTYDIIVSNPPYISSEEIKKLAIEVKDHEPVLALDGKGDGLFFYRIISQEAKKYLNVPGFLLMEIGYDQGESVPQLFEDYENVKVYRDLAGKDRVVTAER